MECSYYMNSVTLCIMETKRYQSEGDSNQKKKKFKSHGRDNMKNFPSSKVRIATASDSHVTNPELLHYHSRLQRRRLQRD